jgi:hypothetical protein
MTTMINFALDFLRINSARLTDAQLAAAKVLGGPHEVGGIVQVEIDGEAVWGDLHGQVVNRFGLRLSPIVHPTYEDAKRMRIADLEFGSDATADAIDRRYAELESINNGAVRS